MITIIGAGVIGLAVADSVAGKDREVYILEKHDNFGLESSSRNSETIHACIHWPEGSLKADFCVAGNAMLYEICEKHGIACIKTGKLLVATREQDTGKLEELLEQGKRNGVKGLEMLSRKQVRELEPNVEAVAAIFSPSTGAIDSYALMRHYLAGAREKGAEIAYKSKVVGLEKLPGGYEVTVEDSSGTSTFKTEVVINCGGLYADEIAGLAGIDIDEAGYRQHYCKGEYFSVNSSKQGLVKMLVYPLPDPATGGKGIHNGFDVDGRMRLGPSAQYVDGIDYGVDESHRELFYDSVKAFLPFIEYGDLEPEMAGIRPKLHGPGEGFRDFVISHEEDRGLPGLMNLLGIESPGLTAAPAIAKYVAGIVEKI